jgi:hypothetical protein
VNSKNDRETEGYTAVDHIQSVSLTHRFAFTLRGGLTSRTTQGDRPHAERALPSAAVWSRPGQCIDNVPRVRLRDTHGASAGLCGARGCGAHISTSVPVTVRLEKRTWDLILPHIFTPIGTWGEMHRGKR